MEKRKGILLPRNYLKFSLVKLIVSNFAYKTLIPTLIPKNAVLGYKKGWILKNYIFFVNLRRYLICVFPSIIAFKHPVKICIEKQIFLYRFMQKAEKCEKYRFWLQKVVKSWIWWVEKFRDPKCVVRFIIRILIRWAEHTNDVSWSAVFRSWR